VPRVAKLQDLVEHAQAISCRRGVGRVSAVDSIFIFLRLVLGGAAGADPCVTFSALSR